jgi:uncharacterized protein (DUF2126 family)
MEPYREEQWAAIDALGQAVDARLAALDARLTMGGEPTYVAADDPDAPEWNVAALGPTKAGYGGALARALAAELAPGALLLHGQGKWYPGEPLPRWMIGVYWRADGEPLWHAPELLADPAEPGGADAADAHRLALEIAARLGLPERRVVGVHEDKLHDLLREAQLPAGEPPEIVTPWGPLPRDARAELIDELDADAGEPVGWALALARDPGDGAWQTGRWTLRRDHLFLAPGDSPIGFRLPLQSLTWRPKPLHPDIPQFEERLELTGGAAEAVDVEPPPVTALCVEVRDGHPHVFLPPLAEFQHAVDLLGVVEAAAAQTGLAIVVEGYPPPRDPRAMSFTVTPDPGVVEINIHPSHSWEELRDRQAVISAAAAQVGLTAEKFAHDGTSVGTGGGSHLTLGGTTPADSLLLRRPDVLRSLITYWQRHPSLSYLFSGRFVGPTSQAPRVDEARHETLYELEIAFNELEKLKDLRPWHVDRALRNLLTDLTGNTHRAEFCVDKLYSPGAESGRLGVLELRGFEMPAHGGQSLVQALLVRALLAYCAETPYREPLVRWGTELHERFLLEHWCAADIRAVIAELGGAGIAFEPAWIEPFVEARFPKLGTVEGGPVTLELRAAVELWNVLGEEAGAGTARYVDSSIERLQVRATGLDPARHAVTCNGWALPLGDDGVAGVRFTASELFTALHPTIPVHTPLVFDIVETATGAVLGGGTYVGKAAEHEDRPADAAEAAGRRAARFVPGEHSAGPVEVRHSDHPAEYARTLDLRRV